MQAATWAPQIQVRIPPELNGAAALHGSWLFFWQLESPGGEFTGDLSVNLSVCPFTHPSIHTCIYPTKPEGKNMYIYIWNDSDTLYLECQQWCSRDECTVTFSASEKRTHDWTPKNIQDQGLKGFLTIKETYWKLNQISLMMGSLQTFNSTFLTLRNLVGCRQMNGSAPNIPKISGF